MCVQYMYILFTPMSYFVCVCVHPGESNPLSSPVLMTTVYGKDNDGIFLSREMEIMSNLSMGTPIGDNCHLSLKKIPLSVVSLAR